MDEQEIRRKCGDLRRLVTDLESAVVAFSGGVDSTLLLRVCLDVLGPCNVLAVTARAPFFPRRELDEASKLAREMGARHRVLDAGAMDDPDFVRNDPERCYVCKKALLRRLGEIAREEGLAAVAEASNLDEAENDFRPGLRAVRECGVRSPLREAGMRKEDVRELSRQLGLSTHGRPSAACLASRIPYGERITVEKLARVERAEDVLRGMGFRQVRVRSHGELARIELGPGEDASRLADAAVRQGVAAELKALGYLYVTLDLEGYRTGSMNEAIRREDAAAGRAVRARAGEERKCTRNK